jgi:hypothetical protein
MSKLSPSEIEKVRKSALHSVTLSSDMKATVVDAKLRDLNAEIKKVLTKKDMILDILLIRSTNS